MKKIVSHLMHFETDFYIILPHIWTAARTQFTYLFMNDLEFHFEKTIYLFILLKWVLLAYLFNVNMCFIFFCFGSFELVEGTWQRISWLLVVSSIKY